MPPLRRLLLRGALAHGAITIVLVAMAAYAAATSEAYERSEASLPLLVRLAFVVSSSLPALGAASAIACFSLATSSLARTASKWVEWAIATGVSVVALTIAVALVTWRAERAELGEALASIGGRHVVPSLWPALAWATPLWAAAVAAGLHLRLLGVQR